VSGKSSRLAAPLLFAVVLLALPVWTPQAWGQTKSPRVAILSFGIDQADAALEHWSEPLRRALAERGWIEGKTVSFLYRAAQDDPSRLAEVASELVQLKVDVIFALNPPGARGPYAASVALPIVSVDFTSDPVAEGYISSYDHPGGNITGVFADAPALARRWLEALQSTTPGLRRIAVVWDPGPGPAYLKAVQGAARSLRLQSEVIEVRKPEDIEQAYRAFPSQAQAIVILPSVVTLSERARLAKWALKQRLPAISMFPAFAESGGAMSLGPDLASTAVRCAGALARILGGAKPGDVPVQRPLGFELSINQQTLKALELTVPDSLLSQASRVVR